MKFQPGSDSGCTAVVALIRGNKLYVANAGDSRCVVCRDGKAVEMSAGETITFVPNVPGSNSHKGLNFCFDQLQGG